MKTYRIFCKKAFYALFFSMCCLNYCAAQSESTTGMDFWLGYGAHSNMFNADGSVNASGGTQDMRLYLTSSGKATVKVEIPGSGWSQTVQLSGGVNSDIVIPKSGLNDARLTGERVFNRGIHISSNNPINAYCHIYASGSSASTLLVPFEILGQDYFTLGAPQSSPEKNSFSYCFVVASADSTLVEVTPAVNTQNHNAGIPFTQVLQKGEVLNLCGQSLGLSGNIYAGADLTGTRIRTLKNGTGLCKKIAVFCGSSSTLISCSQTGTADNIFQQVLPYRAWTKSLLVAPTNKMENNMYRILVNDSTTKVYVNNKLIKGIINGQYYQFNSSDVLNIYAASPILVAQYITSEEQCGNTTNGTNGDPEIIYLSGQQTGDVLIECPEYSSISEHYVNVVIRTVAIDSFSIDKKNMHSFFKTIPIDTAYSYAQIPLTAGSHHLHTDTLAFAATVYGYGDAESYGYNAGFYILGLSTLTVKNPYSEPVLKQVCKTVPFKILFAVKKQATYLNFNFGNNIFLSPNNSVSINNPVADSVYRQGADTFYRYTLPATYTYSQKPDSTNFTVNITMDILTDAGCTEERTITYRINILPKPDAYIGIKYSICGQDTLAFKDSSQAAGQSFINWIWNFGNGKSSSEQDVTESYAAYGNYTVSLRAITNVGCYGDTTKIISLNPLPKVNFSYTGLHCPLNDINFTDSSTILSPWEITKWAWDFGDGTTSSDSGSVKQYNTGGTYNIKLIAYSNKNCSDSAFKSIIIYNPDSFKQFETLKNRYAAAGPLVACNTEPFTLAATFTKRQDQIHWDFLANAQLSPNNNVDILTPVPDSVYYNGQDSFFRYALPTGYSYSSPGSFNIKLTTYTLTKGGCLAQTIFNDTVQVLNKPVADWALLYDSCANDTLYFKNQSAAPGSSVVLWQWQFGDNSASDSTSPVKKYAAYGQYDVALHIVTATGCYADTVKPIALSPKPVAAFGTAGPLFCPNTPLIFTDSSSIASPGKLTTWLWNFGAGGQASTDENPFVQYNAADTYTVSLVVNSDHGCTDTLKKAVTIYNTPTVTLPADVYITSGVPYKITPAYTGAGLTYLWAPPDGLGSDTAAAYPITNTNTNITYKVTVKGEGGCTADGLINIHLEKLIAVPNAFSPNGDGVNDKWIITNIEDYPNCSVRIFDRYGRMIFSSTGYQTPWDGTVNGKPMPVGTYYYIIDTKTPQFPGKAGYLELLR